MTIPNYQGFAANNHCEKDIVPKSFIDRTCRHDTF